MTRTRTSRSEWPGTRCLAHVEPFWPRRGERAGGDPGEVVTETVTETPTDATDATAEDSALVWQYASVVA
jgi:hypothetical protein